ncbi:uncharacterized protein AMSG_04674 [Thecamonas trahens ATCC 50062]|uniref:Uncharacterized protein n=1 Tax=Thecamonas trahens ATCC 50062 TaxID=461836 RepID=A0A0L0D9A9_THETB|nr:hypothetical protein AMSG_04674 [Thecamonas trahens ATCC 50062]KNC48929.1 hypothetical protein AMSG_04674 [Thecamonas trahens ATCC 50062]|eukprot:XP_013758346.1 hypothetical protein AMSG_04674 [Thecamonas trahens ATCC 50062]
MDAPQRMVSDEALRTMFSGVRRRRRGASHVATGAADTAGQAPEDGRLVSRVGCGLTRVPRLRTRVAAHVSRLNLYDNRLGERADLMAVLDALPALCHLNLAANGITRPALKALAALPLAGRLVSLDLSHNDISGRLPRTFLPALKALVSLHLKGNALTGVAGKAPALATPSQLQTLDLTAAYSSHEGNGMARMLQQAFTVMPRSLLASGTALRELYLTNQQLTDLDPVGLRCCTALRKLMLGNNLFTQLPAALPNLPALTWLDMSKNLLTTEPLALATAPRLKLLRLHGNGFDDDREFKELANSQRDGELIAALHNRAVAAGAHDDVIG